MTKTGTQALEAIKGRTVKRVLGLEKDSDEVYIFFEDGSDIVFYHEQDCCESVWLQDFEITTARIEDLIGGVINDAREDIEDGNDDDDHWHETSTWTFYNINTSKGCINMRWLGASNGYYSERVDMIFSDNK